MLEHQMTEHPATAASCETTGNLLYYTCSHPCCSDKCYKDGAPHTTDAYTNRDVTVTPTLGHQWGYDMHCTECNTEAEVAYSGTWGICTWTIYEDVTILRQLILSGVWTADQLQRYDANADGQLTVVDLTFVIDNI